MVIVKEKNNAKPYSIEKRIYEDKFWFKGYFASLEPKWSAWRKFDNYDNLKALQRDLDVLNKNKSYVGHTVEYRSVKN